MTKSQLTGISTYCNLYHAIENTANQTTDPGMLLSTQQYYTQPGYSVVILIVLATAMLSHSSPWNILLLACIFSVCALA